jgi:hypothetical protein
MCQRVNTSLIEQILDYFYIAFIFTYLCEVLVKVIGLGWSKASMLKAGVAVMTRVTYAATIVDSKQVE